jgi:hypothetical protein
VNIEWHTGKGCEQMDEEGEHRRVHMGGGRSVTITDTVMGEGRLESKHGGGFRGGGSTTQSSPGGSGSWESWESLRRTTTGPE